MSYGTDQASEKGDLLYGCRHIGNFLGLSADQVWHLCRKGTLPHFHIGRRLCATRTALQNWLDQLGTDGAS